MPTIYRYQGRWWHGGLYRGIDDTDTNRELLGELGWLIRHGQWHFGWNWPKLIFGGVGRDWYDGPIWFGHFGFFSVSLTHPN
jgi:hypothetical protein